MDKTINRVAQLVLRYRRSSSCSEDTCPTCEKYYRDKFAYFIHRGQPVRFVLPAFPTKSPNRSKTLGPLPDMAEEVAIEFLHDICAQIESVYEPGARLIIASDGRVFSDLIRVDDSDVTRYQAQMARLIASLHADTLSLFNLEDVIDAQDFEEMRRRLVAEYAPAIEEIREQVRAGGEPLSLYRGITRFLFEDARGLHPEMSNTALQKECRERAYGVIQRSKAWGKLVNESYPHAVRLSIHPQECASPKLGIHMVATRDNWLTPWHGVLLATPSGFFLVKRTEAEELGAKLVYIDGQPSHYLSTRDVIAQDEKWFGPTPNPQPRRPQQQTAVEPATAQPGAM